ncbi:MAG: DUF4349 domain-containing protein [Lachnospiraceae bacterium]|nr:DUF4349 domain-containing protein [Lachnospiraceae bacterium]
MKKKTLVCLVLAAVLSLTACGGGSNKSASYERASASSAVASYYTDSDYVSEASYEEAGMVLDNGDYKETSGSESESTKVQDTSRKRIVTYNLEVETENFDDLLAALDERVAFYGGYFESVETYNGSKYNGRSYNRYSRITVRVPSQNAEMFVNFVGDSANITNKNLSSQDVTLAYVDTQSRKETYQTEMERLLALLDKAESIEDILTIEERLSEVRYQLENMESQLRTYDNLIDYTAVYLYVNEVKQYTEPEIVPETYGQRIAAAFKDGWRGFKEWIEDLSVDFVGSLPAWIFLAIVVTAGVFIVKGIIKSKRKKAIRKAEAILNAQKSAENNTNNGTDNGQ